MFARVLLTNLAVAGSLLSFAPADPYAVDLKSHTRDAWDRYARVTEARIATEVKATGPFLWIDRQPAAVKAAHLERLMRGDVVSEPLRTKDGTKDIDVNDGMIHHWIGTVLLPGVALAQARAFVQDYDRYAELFSPTIQRAKVLSREGDQFTVRMRTWGKKMMVTVVTDADYRIDYQTVSPSRLHTKSVATNVHLVESAGEPGETLVPGDKSGGWLWRLNTYCSFEAVPAGTIEQCESISLTRGIPFGLGLLVRPFVSSIPRETLEFTLGRVRAEVGKSGKAGKR